ncbi:hypothetical protein ABGB14_41120 [Nonomuraea sp. B10E15]|uniref:hypothetical protein n=1 Tax=Nonomuraea sp. B10E15 TaxID=3153560 RepID=UPI00325D49B8
MNAARLRIAVRRESAYLYPAAINGGLTREPIAQAADVIVPELADGCGVYLVTDLTGERYGGAPFVVERMGTAARPGMQRLPPYSEEQLPVANAFVKAARRRRPLLKTFPAGSPPPHVAPEGTLPWLTANGANGMLILPVVVDGMVPAVVNVVTCGNRRRLRDNGGL